MIVPQPTAQYGQVDLVSLARAIFNVLSCAYAGFKSKPNTAAAAPPMVVNFRKSRRVGFMMGAPSLRNKIKRGLGEPPNKTLFALFSDPTPFSFRGQHGDNFNLFFFQLGH